MPRVTVNKIIWDETDWINGLHPQYKTSLTDTPLTKMSNKLIAQSSFDPYRHLGYLSPGFDPTDATNVAEIDDLILNGVVGYESSTGYAYLITQGTDLHQMTLSTSTISDSSPWPHTISGSGAETGSDVITYRIGTTNYLFYSWNDSGAAWDVGRYSLDGSTFDDDFLSTTPAGSITFSGNDKPHPMVVGADDILYVGDGNKLHALDGGTGANGTAHDSVLTLPEGYRITSFARLPEYLVVFAYLEPKSGSTTSTFDRSVAQAFFWNYLDLDPTYVYELDDNAVTAAFEFKGTVGCFTQGRLVRTDGENRFSRMKLFNGNTFDSVQEFIGNAPVHGGVNVVGDVIQWNSDGILHQYGSPYEGMPIVLNKIGAGGGSNSGLCKTFSSTGTFMSSGTETSGGLQRFFNNFASSTTFATTAAEPVFSDGKVGKVKSVTVFFAKTSSGGRTLTLTLQDTITGTEQVVNAVQTIDADNMVKRVTYDTSGNQLLRFDALRLIGQYFAGGGDSDAPILRRVEVEYETINTKR